MEPTPPSTPGKENTTKLNLKAPEFVPRDAGKYVPPHLRNPGTSSTTPKRTLPTNGEVHQVDTLTNANGARKYGPAQEFRSGNPPPATGLGSAALLEESVADSGEKIRYKGPPIGKQFEKDDDVDKSH